MTVQIAYVGFYLGSTIPLHLKILKNQKFSIENIKSLRPIIGIRSSNVKKVLKKRAKKNIEKNSPIYLRDIYWSFDIK